WQTGGWINECGCSNHEAKLTLRRSFSGTLKRSCRKHLAEQYDVWPQVISTRCTVFLASIVPRYFEGGVARDTTCTPDTAMHFNYIGCAGVLMKSIDILCYECELRKLILPSYNCFVCGVRCEAFQDTPSIVEPLPYRR